MAKRWNHMIWHQKRVGKCLKRMFMREGCRDSRKCSWNWRLPTTGSTWRKSKLLSKRWIWPEKDNLIVPKRHQNICDIHHATSYQWFFIICIQSYRITLYAVEWVICCCFFYMFPACTYVVIKLMFYILSKRIWKKFAFLFYFVGFFS